MTSDAGRDHWERVRELFDRASGLPPAGRAEFVARECAGNDALRHDVDELIRALTQATEFLDQGVAAAFLQAAGAADLEEGSLLGPYQIIGKLGQGGMGQVFRARRGDDVFHKEVAIKIVPAAFASPALVERFRAERRILATLDHPNIARVLDGGTTGAGAPYLVMEYVPGLPLLEHCNRHQLGVRDRVALFRQVCDAVQYAHENLIVHRDLKPGNVIVTPEGQPKLLDFGIAKLLDPEQSSGPLPQTRPFERMMTPEYASPEQIRGEAVTTATDVYSLGVMLYEVLCGVRPFTFSTSSLGEMERVVCLEDPKPPGLIRKELRGDLENIVAKAMQKSPASRYRSAGQLAEELDRYRNGFPVQARADSALYRLSKFVARNRIAVAAALAVMLSVAAFVVLLIRQRNATDRERAAAERVVQFLIQSFSLADPSENRGKMATARDVLDHGIARIDVELRDEPAIRARLLTTIGEVHGKIGEPSRAIALLERSVKLQNDQPTRDPLSYARALKRLGAMRTTAGQWKEGEQTLGEALSVLRAARLIGGADYGDTLAALANNLRAQGKLTDAEPAIDEALKVLGKLTGETSSEYADCLGIKGQIRYDLGDAAGSLPYSQRALALDEAQFGRTNRRIAIRLQNIGVVLLQQRKFEEAETYLLRALTIFRELYGDQQQDVATAWNDLAVLYSRQRRLEKAAEANLEALRIYRHLHGPVHPYVAAALTNFAQTRRRQGDLDAAAKAVEEAADVARRAVGPDHREFAFTQYVGGVIALDQGRFADAEVRFGYAVRIRKALQGPAADSTLSAESYLGVALQGLGRKDAARKVYQDMLSRVASRKPDNLHRITAQTGLAESCADDGDWACVSRMLDQLRSVAGSGNAPLQCRIALTEGRSQFHANRLPEAEAALRKAHAIQGIDSDLYRALAAKGLAHLLTRTRRYDEAKPFAQAAANGLRRFSAYAPAAGMFD